MNELYIPKPIRSVARFDRPDPAHDHHLHVHEWLARARLGAHPCDQQHEADHEQADHPGRGPAPGRRLAEAPAGWRSASPTTATLPASSRGPGCARGTRARTARSRRARAARRRAGSRRGSGSRGACTIGPAAMMPMPPPTANVGRDQRDAVATRALGKLVAHDAECRAGRRRRRCPGCRVRRASGPMGRGERRDDRAPLRAPRARSTSTRSLPNMSPSRPAMGVATEAVEEVGREDPADAGGRGVERLLHLGQGRRDHRLQQREGKRSQHQHGEREHVMRSSCVRQRGHLSTLNARESTPKRRCRALRGDTISSIRKVTESRSACLPHDKLT